MKERPDTGTDELRYKRIKPRLINEMVYGTILHRFRIDEPDLNNAQTSVVATFKLPPVTPSQVALLKNNTFKTLPE